MKRIGIVFFLFSLASVLFAQVPGGVNYQAVARDGDGNILKNSDMTLRLGIRQGGAAGTLLWQEDHEVTTNAYGLFSVVLGDPAANRTGGTLDSFNDIDWSAGDYYLETSLDITDDGTFIALGSTPVLAVPYAYYARTVGSLNNLEIRDPGGLPSDSALFVVRRADGQPVFVVYPWGVRVYVDTSSAKGPRGGFAIGGPGFTKGPGQEYFRVTPDSVRIYINDTKAKRPRGGFAIGGLGVNKGVPSQYFNVSGAGSVGVIDPSEPRILWYPRKEAFLAGRVLVESPDSVGLNSLSIGYETKAIGQWSTAMGFKSVAAQNYSMAMGMRARAEGLNSFALGYRCKALREGSYAFGNKVIASGVGSFAFGAPGVDMSGDVTDNLTIASGNYSFAFGLGTHSMALGSMAMGANNTADGFFSVALGANNRSSGNGAVALGLGSIASGDNSFAMGDNTTASGYASIAMGEHSLASKNYSFAVGFQASATGENAIALGHITTASGDFSLAAGAGSEAAGKQSVAFGGYAKADLSMALGYGTVANSYASLVLGRYNYDQTGNTDEQVSPVNWVYTDPILVVGNGTSNEDRNNALILYKNGDLTISGNITEASDLRLKTELSPLNGTLSKLVQIQPVYYRFKNTEQYPGDKQIGLIAQEVEKYFPELVSKDSKGYLAVNYSKMTAVLLQAVKEQQQTIEKLTREIDALKQEKKEVAALRKQISELRQLMLLGENNK